MSAHMSLALVFRYSWKPPHALFLPPGAILSPRPPWGYPSGFQPTAHRRLRFSDYIECHPGEIDSAPMEYKKLKIPYGRHFTAHCHSCPVEHFKDNSQGFIHRICICSRITHDRDNNLFHWGSGYGCAPGTYSLPNLSEPEAL